MNRTRTAVRTSILSVAMLALAALVAVPFYYIVVNTLKTQREVTTQPFALPSELDFSNYVRAFTEMPLVGAFVNSLYVTVISVTIMLLAGSMAAYGVIIGKSWFTRIVGVLLIISFLVPFQSTIIPLYQLFARLRLVDSLEGLIFISSGGAIFSYFLIVGYMRTVPMEVLEAARVDGAGSFRIYWSIVLPLIRPILATVAVIQTMGVWNDFIAPSVFISSPEKQTIILQVYRTIGQFTTDWPMFMTITVVALIPMVIFFVALQRQIIGGLAAGSVKG